MAVPKNKISKSKGRSRFANWKVSTPGLAPCGQCHELKANHQVCPKCGYYDGQLVVETKQKKED